MSSIKRYVPTVARFVPDVTLRKRDQGVQGYYIAAAGLSADWRGCAVMHTLDGGQTWTQLARIMRPSVIGVVTEVWDGTAERESGILVRTLHPAMQLESHSEADVEAGKNRAYISGAGLGGTVISYDQAQLIAPQVYALTGLKLGRKQSPFVALGVGMCFTELDTNKLARVDVLDTRRCQGHYSVASINQSIGDEPMVAWIDLQGD